MSLESSAQSKPSRRLSLSRKGTIVIIGSLGGLLPYPFGGIHIIHRTLLTHLIGIYGVFKASVQYIADILRFEMYPFNVKSKR